MMCCICAGSCNHIGNHGYCAAHSYQRFPTWSQPPAFVHHGLFDVAPARYVGRHRKGDPELGA